MPGLLSVSSGSGSADAEPATHSDDSLFQLGSLPLRLLKSLALWALFLPTQAWYRFGSPRFSCRRPSRSSRGTGERPGSYVRALLRGRWSCAAPTPAPPRQTACHVTAISFASAHYPPSPLSPSAMLPVALASWASAVLPLPLLSLLSPLPCDFFLTLSSSCLSLGPLQTGPANPNSGLFPRNRAVTCAMKCPHFCSFVAAPSSPWEVAGRAFTAVAGCSGWF